MANLTFTVYCFLSGAIIGDGDRKSAPFLVLEVIAPSRGTTRVHAVDLCGCCAGMAEIPGVLIFLVHNVMRLRLLEFC